MLLLETGLIGHTFFAYTTAQCLNISEGQFNSPVSHFIHQKQQFQNLPYPRFHLDFGKRNGIEWSVFLSKLLWTAHQADLTEQANIPNSEI